LCFTINYDDSAGGTVTAADDGASASDKNDAVYVGDDADDDND